MSKNTPYSASLINSRFWETRSLADMSDDEWEAICDGCGKCCLHKFIHDDEVEEDFLPTDQPSDDGHLHHTNIACYLFNSKTCACTKYSERSELVPDCVTLTKENLDSIFYMPPSCSYRRLAEGKGLASWHPLLNKGKKTKMHQSGISARNKTVSEHDVDISDFEDYIVRWPLDELE